ncbi:hypothetical protein KRP22_007572 [Phytophthora ramorum]|nr:hypothetical protein KRP22_4417 [Phytophthora ramorum]
MTPVLIRIEQLLDEIRVCTRSIVASASQKIRAEKKRTQPIEREDFRLKLESGDVVDYDSETETEDEGKEEEKGEEPVDTVGVKRSRDAEDGDIQEEPKLKRSKGGKVALDNNSLCKLVRLYVQSAEECCVLKKGERLPIVKKAMNKVAKSTTTSMNTMLEFIRDGGVPSEDAATDFRDATILLPSIIARCRNERKITNKWITATTKNIAEITALARENACLPTCLSDQQLVETQFAITKVWNDPGPELLRKMEIFIDCMSKPGSLNPECMGKPLGKLASLFRNDVKACKPASKSSRTEKDWTRFATIGEVLADWIQQSERATRSPMLRPHLLGFDRQLQGFAKCHPGRVPASLLESSAVLVGFVAQKGSETNTKQQQ